MYREQVQLLGGRRADAHAGREVRHVQQVRVGQQPVSHWATGNPFTYPGNITEEQNAARDLACVGACRQQDAAREQK